MKISINSLRATVPAGARISFVSGNFNIVHPGHLRLLKLAADTADVLVVGLNPDSTPGVTVPSAMRLDGVRALSIVHQAFVMDGPPTQYIAQLKPDFVVKGKEFEGADNPEADVIESYGGKLIFSSGDVQFASMDLLRGEMNRRPLPLLRSANGFPERHDLSTTSLRRVLDKFPGMRVAVVGDIIVDEYVVCDPLGMSQEDPTIVVSPIETRTFVGGSGIVAAHSRRLGAEAHLFTVFGDDDTAAYASNTLESMGVRVHGIVDETRPTTRKQRYRALNKTLLRVSHLRQHEISRQLANKMLKNIVDVLPRIDLLMFSDFNYGCLPQDLVNEISAAARARDVLLTADSQASSQMSDISRFKGMRLVTPTEHEARLALRDTDSGLAVLATDLRAAAAAENVLITLGEGGMMVHGRDGNDDYTTDRLPVLNATPVDVAGAGDSVFTTASMALRTGANIWLASYLSSIAAAIQVSRIGNTPLDTKDLLFEINQLARSATDAPVPRTGHGTFEPTVIMGRGNRIVRS